MKVAFITRSTLHSARGGDTMQVLQMAKCLNQLGVDTEVKLTSDAIDYDLYDLLHFFNITRPADILFHINKSQKPFVLSTILIDYSEYDRYHRKGLLGFLFRFLSRENIEYVKTIGRFLRGKDKIMTRAYWWKGQYMCMQEILSRASGLFPNSMLEYKELKKWFRFSATCLPVYNGVDGALFKFDKAVQKDMRLVLCVARIEGIKNQMNLIRALNDTDYQLVIIGSPAPNQVSYYKGCKELAASNVTFIEHLEQEELVHYYQKAAVHVLPSWFETCGLSSLEAGAMGCNIVITNKGFASEYYENYAFYCDPSSPVSIKAAVDKAICADYPGALRQKILSLYTWQHAARSTANAYKSILTSP
jgi:glycosyltransferase involved in cell wall biosynthesis